MSDIKRLVSAATTQWLPVALGALAVPSGARHQRKSPQSQGPSACVCARETWWMSSRVLWEPPWKRPHSEATKVLFCFFSSAFSFFIYLNRIRREDSLSPPSLSFSLSISPSVLSRSAGLTHHRSPLPSWLPQTSMSDAVVLQLYPHSVSAEPQLFFFFQDPLSMTDLLLVPQRLYPARPEWSTQTVPRIFSPWVWFGLGQGPLPCRSFPDLRERWWQRPHVDKLPCNRQEAFRNISIRTISKKEVIDHHQIQNFNHCNIKKLHLMHL